MLLKMLGLFAGEAAVDWWLIVVAAVVGIGLGAGIFFLVDKQILAKRINSAKNQANTIIDEAKVEAKTLKKEAILEAKEEILKQKTEFEKETKERNRELTKQEDRLIQREGTLDKKEDALLKRQEQQEALSKSLQEQQGEIARKQAELEKYTEKISAELERVSGMTKEEARETLVESIIAEARRDAVATVRGIEQEARENGEKKAREIISSAIQRCAADQVSEVTITAIPLPNDDMKGRLIGREGRNIRAIENATRRRSHN